MEHEPGSISAGLFAKNGKKVASSNDELSHLFASVKSVQLQPTPKPAIAAATSAATPATTPGTAAGGRQRPGATVAVKYESDDDEVKIWHRRKLKLQQDDPAKLQRTLFVGNVPCDAKKQTLRRLFAKHGTVESVRFRSGAFQNVPTAGSRSKMDKARKVAAMQKQYDTSVKETVNAYIVMAVREDAQTVIVALNGQQFEGHHLRVDFASLKKGCKQAIGSKSSQATTHDHKRSVFLGNLPFSVQEEQIWGHFSEVGPVQNVRLIRDPATNEGKGFGYVLFEDEASVERALQLHESSFQDREIRVFRSRKDGGAAKQRGKKEAAVPRFMNKKLTSNKGSGKSRGVSTKKSIVKKIKKHNNNLKAKSKK